MPARIVGVLCVAFLLLSGMSMSGQAPPEPEKTPERISKPGVYALALQVGDRARHYIVHVPPTYDGRRRTPIVVMLHGGGGTARAAMVETGWSMKADKSGFLAVFPEGTAPDSSKPSRFAGNPQTWNDGSGRFYSGQNKIDDVGFMNALLDDLIARFTVDTRRIYVTGFSNGASMAFRLGVEMGQRIAAVAPVSGYLWLKKPKLEHPVPLLYMIGTEDPLVPLEGGKVKPPWAPAEIRLPARDSVTKWAEMLGCPPEPKVDREKEGIKILTYGPGKSGAEVVFYIIEGMGHTWPGGKRLLPERVVGKTTDKIKANDVIWDFFRKHPRK